jgi:hypothetical protein
VLKDQELHRVVGEHFFQSCQKKSKLRVDSLLEILLDNDIYLHNYNVPNYKSLWLFYYIHFATYLDIRYV